MRADGSRAAQWKPNQEKKKSRANKNRYTLFLLFVLFFSRLFCCCLLIIFDCFVCDEIRPMELSSKRPVSRYREVIQVPKKVNKFEH